MKSLNVKYLKHENGDLYAVLYDEARPTYNGMLTMYSHIGQHGEGSISYVLESSDAQSHEYKELHAELKKVYEGTWLNVINEDANINLERLEVEECIYALGNKTYQLSESDKLEVLSIVLKPHETIYTLTPLEIDELRELLNRF